MEPKALCMLSKSPTTELHLQSLVYLCIYLFFGDRVSPCSIGCPGTHYVAQAGLELMILLPLPPSAGITNMSTYAQLPFAFFVCV
jgi:hypothetical protein